MARAFAHQQAARSDDRSGSIAVGSSQRKAGHVRYTAEAEVDSEMTGSATAVAVGGPWK
jgi:hypothetical protein